MLSIDSPIIMLGQFYTPLPTINVIQGVSNIQMEVTSEEFALFLTHFQSNVWLTYRYGFSKLHNSSITTDMGWGCLIRTTQMMIAKALLDTLAGTGSYHHL